jgi:RimJ/RimL family protein N-acetyltransferase
MGDRVDPGSVEVRDLAEADIPFVLDYWFRSPPGFVESLGADPARLPSETLMAETLRDKIRATPNPQTSRLNALAILLHGRPVGMHVLNPLTEGDWGIFHAHLWNPLSRGRGIAERSYPLACRLFLDRFGLQRILFKTPAQNLGALRVKEKLGIRYLGEERADFGIIKAGTLVRAYELTREEAASL